MLSYNMMAKNETPICDPNSAAGLY